MKKILCAALALLWLPIASASAHDVAHADRSNYPTGKRLTACLMEHELAHAGGWAASHPGAILRKDCGGLIMPPHKFPLNGKKVTWHWVSPSVIPFVCGPNALACTYMGSAPSIYMPTSDRTVVRSQARAHSVALPMDFGIGAQAPAPEKVLKYTDRKPVPLYKKLNPLWWFANDANQTVEQAPWYHPEWPLWKRKLYWNFRNPMQNFGSYVLGVKDRNYEVRVIKGNPDPRVVQRNDVGEYGYQIVELRFKSGLKLYFISYSGKHFVWYAGWQPNGFFGFKFNTHTEGSKYSTNGG